MAEHYTATNETQTVVDPAGYAWTLTTTLDPDTGEGTTVVTRDGAREQTVRWGGVDPWRGHSGLAAELQMGVHAAQRAPTVSRVEDPDGATWVISTAWTEQHGWASVVGIEGRPPGIEYREGWTHDWTGPQQARQGHAALQLAIAFGIDPSDERIDAAVRA